MEKQPNAGSMGGGRGAQHSSALPCLRAGQPDNRAISVPRTCPGSGPAHLTEPGQLFQPRKWQSSDPLPLLPLLK